MSLNDTPSGERAHIVFFGVRNAGKSSLVNALTNQTVSVVSDVAGTTTDPVRKAMELAPAGPVLVIDTPGIDDAGDVGDLRVQRAEAALNEADVAVLVMDATRGMTSFDERLIAAFQARRIPYVIAENKADLLAEEERAGSSDQPSLFEPGKILCPTAAPESSECLCASLREEDGASERIEATAMPPCLLALVPVRREGVAVRKLRGVLLSGPPACAYRRERARAWTT